MPPLQDHIIRPICSGRSQYSIAVSRLILPSRYNAASAWSMDTMPSFPPEAMALSI